MLKLNGRKRLGLALGGGVIRGLAHIGVLSALEEAGIPVDYVSGASVGAVIAAAYCAGWDSEKLYARAGELNWWRIVRPVWPARGLISFTRLARWMVQEIGDLDFSDLQIPCTLAATDLERGEPVSLNQGRVALAVQASCSVPTFVTPVEIDGRLLCDGGATNMLPVTALREMGADYVIAVDLFAPTIRRSLGALGYGVAAVEILLQRSGCGVEQADCLIRPELGGKTYLRFSKLQELYQLGRQATLQKLDCIRQGLGAQPLVAMDESDRGYEGSVSER